MDYDPGLDPGLTRDWDPGLELVTEFVIKI